MDNCAVEPDFDSIITTDMHRHTVLCSVCLKLKQRIGGMVIHVAVCHADTVEALVDVIPACR